MTAYLVVTSGCAYQTGWTTLGDTNFDIGIIEDENNNKNSGFELITQTLGTSSQSRGMNLLGQQRIVKLKGVYIASSLSDAQEFEHKLSLIQDWQLHQGAVTTFYYYNVSSKIYAAKVSPGLKCMMKDYNIPANNSRNPLIVPYTITIQECTNL